MSIKSRQLVAETTKSSLPKGKNYCRRCEQVKLKADFYQALDGDIDKNGHMSVCKDCIGELIGKYLETDPIELAILKICRSLNVMYDQVALQTAIDLSKKRVS